MYTANQHSLSSEYVEIDLYCDNFLNNHYLAPSLGRVNVQENKKIIVDNCSFRRLYNMINFNIIGKKSSKIQFSVEIFLKHLGFPTTNVLDIVVLSDQHHW